MFDLEDTIVKQESQCSRILYHCFCDHCGANRGYKRRNEANSLCKICFNKIKHTGKIVSDESKQKMSEKSKGHTRQLGKKRSDATKQLLSEKQQKYCAEHGNQFIIGKSRGKHTVNTINKISDKNCGKEPKWKGRTFQYIGPKGLIKLRSSYELFYANWLDNNGIQWEYEPKFKLSDGKMYAPDFKVLHDDIIIEIKGYWAPIGKKKWEMFCTEYPDVKKKVLMKEDLIKLGMEDR
jgi:predicted nuclease of restriction endonuclease-like RecB superfamily